MKALILAALVFTAGIAKAQELPKAAPESIDLRLELASSELQKSAGWGDGAIYATLLGGATAAILARDNEKAAMYVGGVTVAIGYSFALVSSGHKRRAGKALHQ